MKNIFFTNRLLLILSILLLCIFALSTSVLGASNVEFTGTDIYLNEKITYSIPKDIYDESFGKYEYNLAYSASYEASGTKYFMLVVYSSDNPLYCGVSPDGAYWICYQGNVFSSNMYFEKSGNKYVYSKQYASTHFYEKLSFISMNGFNPSCFVSSNHDILKYDAENKELTNEVVFQGAPQVPEITKALVEQTTQLGMKPLEIIKVVLPIVIVIIVGLIAFWKAWQVLSKQLKKA